MKRRTFIGMTGAAALQVAAPFVGKRHENAFIDERPPNRGIDTPLVISDRQGFNRRWYASQLEAVYVPRELDDVVKCVNSALSSYGRDVKITSGRHCYENFVYNNSTRAIIDMSVINKVGFDFAKKAYFIDSGCELWTVYRTLLNSFGKTLPAGSCYSVGSGGHITGGGYGMLSRMHGLTVDYLTGVDIVTWDSVSSKARLHHVSHSSNEKAERDLFWALRGAGCGNFGVIVRFYFESLPDAPDRVTLWTTAWNWSDISEASFASLLHEYSNLINRMPQTDFSILALNHVAAGQIGFLYQAISAPGITLAEHRASIKYRLQKIRDIFANIAPADPTNLSLGGHLGKTSAPLIKDIETELTYLESLQILNSSGPNRFGKYKSAYMKKEFPISQVKAIYEWLHVVPNGLNKSDMSQSLLQIDSYGGKINSMKSNYTPVFQRDCIMKLQYQTYWTGNVGEVTDWNIDIQRGRIHVDWINRFYNSVYAEYGGIPDPEEDPSETIGGCYFNYPDVELGSHQGGDVERALRLYFLDNFRKNTPNLVSVKGNWDPGNYFHHAQSLPVK